MSKTCIKSGVDLHGGNFLDPLFLAELQPLHIVNWF